MSNAVYPGSLDPITYGHISAIQDTAESFGEVTVAIGVNPSKNYLFSLAEREFLVRKALSKIENTSVTSFSGLLVHFLVRNNLNIVVRGVRNGGDLDDAMLQETIGWQQTMAEKIKAFYVPARPGKAFISSSALKAVLKEQGDATHLAPLSTIHATQARMLSQYFYGITGVSGSGKSTVCKKFKEIADERNIPLFHVDMDKIAHDILNDECDPIYINTRKSIEVAFGSGILDENGFIVRKRLGEIVFGNPEKLKILNGIMHDPVFFKVNDMLRGRKGIFLIDGALLAETGKTSFVNNNVLIVQASQEKISERLRTRDNLSVEQIERRSSSQFSTETKMSIILDSIESEAYGDLNCYDSNVIEAFDEMLNQVDIYGELRITGFLKRLGAPEAAYNEIRKLYSSSDRFYHSLSHIVYGLNKMPAFFEHINDKDAFTLAWIFHDSVYDSREKDNEEKSADLVEKMCLSWGIENALFINRVKKYILATKHGHVKPENSDEEWLVDLDMSIIGSTDYATYEENVRREYSWLSMKDWVNGRHKFLSGLEFPYFYNDYFINSFSENADKNIKDSLEKLND